MSGNSLENLPVTGRTARLLLTFFGSEKAALDAIREGRLGELASIPGIGLKTGIQIIKKYWSKTHGIHPKKILASEDIQRVYRELWKIIRSFFQTPFAHAKLSTYYP
ncbi:MAG: hypothetical protein ACTSYO_05420, partial [Candidatus Ranarchaeia archaeon]